MEITQVSYIWLYGNRRGNVSGSYRRCVEIVERSLVDRVEIVDESLVDHIEVVEGSLVDRMEIVEGS